VFKFTAMRCLIVPFLLGLLSSSPALAQFGPTQTVGIPMRDGQSLAADVYVPAGCTQCPTILIQTPYNKNVFHNGLPMGFLQNLNASPYSWVVVDWRGFYASAAAAVAQPNRGEDGYDVIDWIVQQPWSDGKVGTWGPSALGVIQWQTAREQHPGHVCAVPVVSKPQTAYSDYYYGGGLEKSRLAQMDALGYGLSTIVLANPYHNIIWTVTENNSWYPQSITIPTLQIGGWYDHNIDPMMKWYEATRQSSAPAVREKQWLLVGPWVHGGTGAAYVGSAQQGELSYPDAAFRNDSMARAFFAFYLLDDDNGWEDTPLVTYYRLGASGWETTDDADIADSAGSSLHLSANGELRNSQGTGSTAFTSDPRNPSPTLGGHTLHTQLTQGPLDQAALLEREDVLSFATPPLLSDLTITGRPRAVLHISADRPDADIVIRLVDGHPDGRDMLINDGIRRVRFRNGYTQAQEALMQPGTAYQVEVELPFVHYTWKEGHRIKAYVSGNSAIRWDVNLQNGGTMYAAGDTNVAEITIHHDAMHPSRLVLPGSNPVLSVNGAGAGDGALRVMPNPSDGVFTVYRTGNGMARTVVTDMMGRTVSDAVTDAAFFRADLSDRPPGVYLLSVFTDGEVRTVRLVRH